jgi:predicted CoA-binding protein
MKRTVIIGASNNPNRYSYLACVRLEGLGHEVFPIGIREGNIQGTSIITDRPELKNIDTITLYVGPKHQASWLDYMISLSPKRIIFNPGTEDRASIAAVREAGIQAEVACTLVMLSADTY